MDQGEEPVESFKITALIVVSRLFGWLLATGIGYVGIALHHLTWDPMEWSGGGQLLWVVIAYWWYKPLDPTEDDY